MVAIAASSKEEDSQIVNKSGKKKKKVWYEQDTATESQTNAFHVS